MAGFNFSVREIAENDYRHGRTCSRRNCNAPVTHLTRYYYRTGRAGRIGYADKGACAGCAQKFASSHNVQVLPPEEHSPAHATDLFRSVIGAFTVTPGSVPPTANGPEREVGDAPAATQ